MKNAHGMLTRAPKEWGSKARKQEAQQRGFRRRGLMDTVNEGLAEMVEDEEAHAHVIDPFYDYDDHKIRDPWEYE